MLKSCFRPPTGTSWTAGDNVSGFYRSWGFAIYRTAYGPATDTQWRILLDKIWAQITLFVLDARSDAALLADKTMEEVCEIYKQAAVASRSSGDDHDNDDSQSLPLMRDSPNQRAFFLADAEVLEGVDWDSYFWVKCVEADFAEGDLAEANSAPATPWGRRRAAVRPWSGWMKMTTRSVVDLFAEMPVRDLARIAPGARAADEMPLYNRELTRSSLTSKMSSGNIVGIPLWHGLHQLAIRNDRLPRVPADHNNPQLQVFFGQRLLHQRDLHHRLPFIAVNLVQIRGERLRRIRPSNDWVIQWAGYNETCNKDPKTKSYCNGEF
ncbi:hypothetical protein Landi51_07443 [Colletotrichum acutatum]